jgi:N-acetyl-gamma-glutamyl-phosphate reductase
MIVQLPLHLSGGLTASDLEAALKAHYGSGGFVEVVDPAGLGARVDPQRLNGTNRMELSVHPGPEGDRVVLLATLDNLGKGASGAAVQNLNIMLGVEETAGLV